MAHLKSWFLCSVFHGGTVNWLPGGVVIVSSGRFDVKMETVWREFWTVKVLRYAAYRSKNAQNMLRPEANFN